MLARHQFEEVSLAPPPDRAPAEGCEGFATVRISLGNKSGRLVVFADGKRRQWIGEGDTAPDMSQSSL